MYFDVVRIPDFPNYDLTVDGRVINIKTGREMALSPTMQGELTVGLVRDEIDEDGMVIRVQHRRSVKVLVAQLFVDGQTPVFNTPILLDLDKHNLHADNIRWRPRWFAWKYARQVYAQHSWFYNGPILDATNNVQYSTIYDAALTNGLLCQDIHMSLLNGSLVFPSGERYVYI